jgi:hypothetical protein
MFPDIAPATVCVGVKLTYNALLVEVNSGWPEVSFWSMTAIGKQSTERTLPYGAAEAIVSNSAAMPSTNTASSLTALATFGTSASARL